jgi:phage-related tail protein
MKKTIAILIALSVTACATRPMGAEYRPIVDMQGKDVAQYESDLGQCQTYAQQAAGAAQRAAGAAVAGALLGALLMKGAGVGNEGHGAAVGALAAGARGAADGEHDQRSVITRCLAGRGYSVLG